MSGDLGSIANPLDQVRMATVEWLRAREPSIVSAIYARIQDSVPDPINDTNPPYQAGVLAAITAIVTYAFEALEHGAGWSAPLPPAAAVQARSAARAGVSLGTVQRRYFAGHRELGEFVAQAAEHLGLSNDGHALNHLRRTQEALLGHLAGAIEEEYSSECELIAGPAKARLVQTVQRLLAGEPVDPIELDRLDYELHASWHVGVVATGEAAGEILCDLRSALERKLLLVSCSDGVVWGWFGGNQEFGAEDLERLLPGGGHNGVTLAIGSPGKGVNGWRQTHREARDALPVALCKAQEVIRYEESPVLAAATQSETLVRWLEGFLAPLRNHNNGGADLRRTLRAFIDSECNRRAAAAALNVDRHTVESRLRTAERLLGRTLRTCLVELDIALRVVELNGACDNNGTPSGPTDGVTTARHAGQDGR